MAQWLIKPGQGTRSHTLQLKMEHTTIKTQCSEINKYLKKKDLKNLKRLGARTVR